MKGLLMWTVIGAVCCVSASAKGSSQHTTHTDPALSKGGSQKVAAVALPQHALQGERTGDEVGTTSRSSSALVKFPLSFESNAGQADPKINFISRGRGYTLLTSADMAVISTCTRRIRSRMGVQRSPAKDCSHVALQMHFLDANQHARAIGERELSGKSNYFIGSDRSRWHVNVPHFEQVRYSKVYPGIDLVYYGNEQRLEYDFLINPDANPAAIAFTLDGIGQKRNPALSARLTANGELVMQTDSLNIRLQRPKAYQLSHGKKEFIPVRYTERGQNRIGFDLGKYDRSKQLIIDPVLSYSSFLGGSSDDFGYAIAIDSAGNIYVTGGTTSADFPVSPGVLKSTYAGADSNVQGVHGDVFITKLDPTGKTVLYSTYIGGTADDNAYGIAVDSAGNAYLAGATNSADFPVTTGALQTSFGGGPDDVFVLKLNPTGSALVYSTYVGTGLGGERGFGIAVDAAGDAYITGDAAPDFPVTTGSYHGGVNDAELTELNPSGSALVFSIFFGGNGLDEGLAIALDAAGNISITGATTSTDLPVTANAVQAKLAGGQDAFVAQFDKSGSLIYCSYLGGSADELGSSLGAIAVDGTGRIYVTGSTASADYPTTTGAFQTTYGGGLSDVFVTAIDPSKSPSLVYSTLLGGSGDDDTGEFARGVAVDEAGNAIITGNTTSANFPTLHALQSNAAGGQDAFVSKLNAAGSALLYSTYLGGTGDDFGAGVVVDKVGNTFLTGQTTSTNFPTNTALQGTLNGPSDSFIAKLSADFDLSSSPTSASITAGQTATYTVTVSSTDGLYGLPVSLACTGAPSLSTCTISPQQVTPGSVAVPATVTITTTAPQISMLHILGNATGVYALFLPLLWLCTRKARCGSSAKLLTIGWVLGIVVLLVLVSLVGCGGNSSPPKQQKPGTPSGTSTITISGSSSSMNHATTVTLNVI